MTEDSLYGEACFMDFSTARNPYFIKVAGEREHAMKQNMTGYRGFV